MVGAQPSPYCSFARHLVGKMGKGVSYLDGHSMTYKWLIADNHLVSNWGDL